MAITEPDHEAIIQAAWGQPAEEREFRAANAHTGEQREELFFHECPDGLAGQARATVRRIRELETDGVPFGEVGILASRWQDCAEFEVQLAAEGIPYRVAKARTYKPTTLTIWVERAAQWCAGGWATGKPRFSELFAVSEYVDANTADTPSHAVHLERRAQTYAILRSLRAPTAEVGAWLCALDQGLRLSELVARVDAVPIRMRHDVRELGVMLESLKNSRQPLDEFAGVARNKVVLQTIHGSKGLEYQAVFIAALEAGVLPRYGDDLREARRLFYVALTRAKREVHLLWSGFFYTANGEYRSKGRSPLVNELVRRLSE